MAVNNETNHTILTYHRIFAHSCQLHNIIVIIFVSIKYNVL